MLKVETLKPTDTGILRQYFENNRDRLTRFENWPDFKDDADYEKFVATKTKQMADNKTFTFKILVEDQMVGMVFVESVIRHPFHSCYLGYSVDRDHEGKGYVTQALRIVQNVLRDDLKLHKALTMISVHNARSKAVMQRLEYTFVGTIPQHTLLRGEWEDMELYVKTL